MTEPRPLEHRDIEAGFDCGRHALNWWFQQHAWRNQLTGASRTSVLPAPDGSVIGYVSLSAGEVRRGQLPKPSQRNKPDPVPVILLGQLAVARVHQSQGHARVLLHHAIRTTLRASLEIGCIGLVTHPFDAGLAVFYRHLGFIDLPESATPAMILRLRDIAKAGFGP